jgi:hypothetical protein
MNFIRDERWRMKGCLDGIGEEEILASDFHGRTNLSGRYFLWIWNSTPGLPHEISNLSTIEELAVRKKALPE